MLKALGHPQRLRIVQLLGEDEQCVCHLTAALGLRQATVSQHLATLRRAGIVRSRRDGLNTFYRLVDRRVLDALRALGLEPHAGQEARPVHCPCPRCAQQARSPVLAAAPKQDPRLGVGLPTPGEVSEPDKETAADKGADP